LSRLVGGVEYVTSGMGFNSLVRAADCLLLAVKTEQRYVQNMKPYQGSSEAAAKRDEPVQDEERNRGDLRDGVL